MSAKTAPPLTRRPLFYWIVHRYRGLQFLLLGTILVSLFFRVFPLEMQRSIINQAISLRKLDLLYLYCGLYLGAVIIAGLLKYFINSFMAIIGQKLLIEMRRELYNHILRLPLPFFYRTQTGTIISAMTAELNAIGNFLGGALAIPVTALLTFLVFAGYMIYLNPFLGLISIMVYPFELVIVPMLQRRYNVVNQVRVTTTRAMANLVNEAASGIHEVQSNSSYNVEKGKLDRLIDRLYLIMRRMSILKYGIKFSNNLFQSMGPFLLFLIGGYLAINGQFTIGALVAFLSAYEKVYDPWKEIIEYYQGYQDAQVRYRQIMEAFDHQPEYQLIAPENEIRTLRGDIEATGLVYQVNENVRLLDDVTFSLKGGSHLALVGYSGSGKSTLSMLLGQLYRRSGGTLTLDGYEIDSLSKTEIARNISFVAQHPFIFTGTVRENLLYSCQALKLQGAMDDLPDRNTLITMIDEVGLAEDVLRWGLRTVIHPDQAYQLVDKLLKMRNIAFEELQSNFAHVVEFYDPNTFLEHSTLAVNLIFSSYRGSPRMTTLISNQPFRTFIDSTGIETQLVELGYNIARETIQFLGDFREDKFFFQGSPMEPGQFSTFVELTAEAERRGLAGLDKEDREMFLTLALHFIPGKHKIYTISEDTKAEIVGLRQTFLQNVLGIDLDQCKNGILQRTIYDISQVSDSTSEVFFTPYCASQYLYSHSLLDNIIFGTVIDRDVIRRSLGPILLHQFKKQGLLDDVFEIGLNFHVGSKGDNLSGGQKQKIALARALLKNCPILILDEATASLDNSSQAKIQRYIETKLQNNTTVIAVVHRLDMISGYDHILVMKAGKIVESGTYSQLMEAHGALYDLANNN